MDTTKHKPDRIERIRRRHRRATARYAMRLVDGLDPIAVHPARVWYVGWSRAFAREVAP